MSERDLLNLLSDNQAPISPEVLSSLLEENAGTASPYGRDEVTGRLNFVFGELFETELEVIPVPTSSGGNGLALSLCIEGCGCVVGERSAHIMSDEAGAVEFQGGGCRLLQIRGKSGKMKLSDLENSVIAHWLEDYSHSMPQALSIGQLTDCGTMYNKEEIEQLSNFCKGHSMYLHMDGTRFANAVASLGVSPAEISWKSGVDVLTFGVTKNGGLLCDAVIIFSESLRRGAWRRLKRAGGNFSKMRFASSQLLGYLRDDNWLKRAKHSNSMAKLLSRAIENSGGGELLYEVEGNMIFALLEEELVERLGKYVKFSRVDKYDKRAMDRDNVYRFVLPWNVSRGQIEKVVSEL